MLAVDAGDGAGGRGDEWGGGAALASGALGAGETEVELLLVWRWLQQWGKRGRWRWPKAGPGRRGGEQQQVAEASESRSLEGPG